jgi:hypothetical protein
MPRLLNLVPSRLAGSRNGQDSSISESPGVAKARRGETGAFSDWTYSSDSKQNRRLFLLASSLRRTPADVRSLKGHQTRHGESRARWRPAHRPIFPPGARQPDDAAHATIMIQYPTERPMNAGDKPSPASWRRAAGDIVKAENPAKQGGLTDSCSEPCLC